MNSNLWCITTKPRRWSVSSRSWNHLSFSTNWIISWSFTDSNLFRSFLYYFKIRLILTWSGSIVNGLRCLLIEDAVLDSIFTEMIYSLIESWSRVAPLRCEIETVLSLFTYWISFTSLLCQIDASLRLLIVSRSWTHYLSCSALWCDCVFGSFFPETSIRIISTWCRGIIHRLSLFSSTLAYLIGFSFLFNNFIIRVIVAWTNRIGSWLSWLTLLNWVNRSFFPHKKPLIILSWPRLIMTKLWECFPIISFGSFRTYSIFGASISCDINLWVILTWGWGLKILLLMKEVSLSTLNLEWRCILTESVSIRVIGTWS